MHPGQDCRQGRRRTKSLEESRTFIPVGLVLVLALTAWIFRGVLGNPFHFDDSLFLQSPQVTEPGNPWYLIKPTQTRQLTYLTFYWNYRLGTTSPAGYHLINLVLHLANVVAIYWFCLLLVRRAKEQISPLVRRWLPLAAAGIFGLHPVQTEAVNYVYQRSVLLAALCALLSMSCFLRSQTSQRRKAWLAGAAVSFFLAVASKESALVLPLIWVAFTWAESADFRNFRQQLGRSRWIWTVLALAAGGAIWTLYVLWRRGESTQGLMLGARWLQYLLAQIQVLATYLRLLLFPAGLSIDHDFRAAPAASIYSMLCLLTFAGIVVFAARTRRQNPTASFLVLAFLIFLAPTSSIVPSRDLLFEHRLYLPMIAASIFMAWVLLGAIPRIVKTGNQRIAASLVCVCLLLGSYAVASKRRTHIWGDGVRLWEDAAAKAPLKPRVHYNLGIAYLDRDRQKAKQEFQRTLELDETYAPALYNLGWLAQTAKNYDDAKKYYRSAIQADPNTWQAYHNLGNIDILQSHYQDALKEFAETIRRRADYWPAYLNLALVQLQTGNTAAASKTLQTLKQMRWDLLEARYMSAYVLVREGKFEEAENDLRFLVEHDMEGSYGSRVAELRRLLPARQ